MPPELFSQLLARDVVIDVPDTARFLDPAILGQLSRPGLLDQLAQRLGTLGDQDLVGILGAQQAAVRDQDVAVA